MNDCKGVSDLADGRVETHIDYQGNHTNCCLQALFEAQVRRAPDATAIVHESVSLTYTQLNDRANQLAWYLMESGLLPGQLVGIYMDRGIDMIVAIIGILKAGGAYLPLDPVYPTERLKYILNDAAPMAILSQSSLRERLPAAARGVISWEAAWSQIGQRYTANPIANSAGTDQLAYVIYTSGSTGEPKGVMVEHRNVTRLFENTQKWFGFDNLDVWTLFHSIAFDFSVWELWGALLHGGRLVVVPYATARSSPEFYNLLCTQRVTVLNQTPSAFVQLIDAQIHAPHPQHSLRLVVFGGETLEFSTLRQWIARNGVDQPRLVNMYGITETTVHVTYFPIGREDIESTRASLIGVPIGDLEIRVLDARFQAVKHDAVGEIYVGGAGVARGYLKRAELTASRFVADPLGTGRRLYRSGDLGRWRDDGRLEYVGRNDHQVKIRGFRIELGEIEATIGIHPSVKQALVLAPQSLSGDRQLVAYVVAAGSESHSSTAEGVNPELRRTSLNEWEALYESTYEAQPSRCRPNFVGWNSSYTGAPLPEREMSEWLSCTVQRIRALGTKRILEIGCGVGLLLEQLAPLCDFYHGTDFSKTAVDSLKRWVRDRGDLSHVEISHRSAEDLQDIESRSMDTVILNSVAQYFPDIHYFLMVLKEMVRLCKPGGHIFLGDIRHLGLLPTFHCGVQMSRSTDVLSVGQLRNRIAHGVENDKELVIEPAFFPALLGELQGVSAVEVLLKRGKATNELTAYRYDVVLTRGNAIDARTIVPSIDWQACIGSLPELQVALRERRWDGVRLVSIGNRRVLRDAEIRSMIDEADEKLSVGPLRDQLNTVPLKGVDPEAICVLAEAEGFEVTLRPGEGEFFEAELVNPAQADHLRRDTPKLRDHRKPWTCYCNDPLVGTFQQELLRDLRDLCKRELPEYMAPSAWVFLKKLPLTPNGKIDRRALPEAPARATGIANYVAPRTGVERFIAEIWEDVLRVDHVGVNDNFFEIGGHSLHGMKLTAEIGEKFGIRFSPVTLFRNPTIEQLAKVIELERSGDVISIAGKQTPTEEWEI